MQKPRPVRYNWLFEEGAMKNAARRFKDFNEDTKYLMTSLMMAILSSPDCGAMVTELLSKRNPAQLIGLELFQAGVAMGLTLYEQKEENDGKR